MTRAAVALAVLVLAGCGGSADDPARAANTALLDRLPVYPGLSHAKTTHVHSGDTSFAARDWSLPDEATAQQVVGFYRVRLQQRGWRIDAFSNASLSAVRGRASVDVGVRGGTVEIVARAT